MSVAPRPPDHDALAEVVASGAEADGTTVSVQTTNGAARPATVAQAGKR